MEERLKKILSALENQCARREYCSSDILDKALKKTEGNRDEAREIVDLLIENNYVNDLRYASAYAREKSSITGWGPAKIRFALSAKKIPSAIIKEALEQVEPEKSSSRMERLLETKWSSLKDDPQGRLKLIRFALSRGYSYDQIQESISAITSCRASDDI